MAASGQPQRRRAAAAAAVVAGVFAGSVAAASCDPVEAMHTLWQYLTTGRKELEVKKEVKADILKVRNEFHLRNVDVGRLAPHRTSHAQSV